MAGNAKCVMAALSSVKMMGILGFSLGVLDTGLSNLKKAGQHFQIRESTVQFANKKDKYKHQLQCT